MLLDFKLPFCVPHRQVCISRWPLWNSCPALRFLRSLSEPANTIQIFGLPHWTLSEIRICFPAPLPPDSAKVLYDLRPFIDNYQVKCINGKMCYAREAAGATFPQNEPREVSARCLYFKREQYTKNRSLPFSLKSEDSGINAINTMWNRVDEDRHRGRSGTELRGRLQPREQLGARWVHPPFPAVWSGSDWDNRNHCVRARAGSGASAPRWAPAFSVRWTLSVFPAPLTTVAVQWSADWASL